MDPRDDERHGALSRSLRSWVTGPGGPRCGGGDPDFDDWSDTLDDKDAAFWERHFSRPDREGWDEGLGDVCVSDFMTDDPVEFDDLV